MRSGYFIDQLIVRLTLCLLVIFILTPFVVGHDEFNCVTIEKITWHRPTNINDVFIGQTSWVQFDIKLLDIDPETMNKCRWIKKAKIDLELDASSMGGDIAIYPVDTLEDVSIITNVSKLEGRSVGTETFALWRAGVEFSTKLKHRSFFFITGMPTARPGKNTIVLKVKATISDEAWVDRVEYCQIEQTNVACRSRCAGDQNCLVSCTTERTRLEQECGLIPSRIVKEWDGVAQGVPRPLDVQVKLPYKLELDSKSMSQYVGESSKLYFKVTNIGVEPLEEPSIHLELPDEDQVYVALGDTAIELDRSVVLGETVEGLDARLRVTEDAWARDSTLQPIQYLVGGRLEFVSGMTRLHPEVSIEYSKKNAFTLKNRVPPRIELSIVDPGTGLALARAIDPIRLTPFSNVTLIFDVRNSQQGYAHECQGRLTLPADVLDIVSGSYPIRPGNRTKLGEEYFFDIGDLEKNSRKEIRALGVVKAASAGDLDASFTVVNCKDANRQVQVIPPRSIKLRVENATVDIVLSGDLMTKEGGFNPGDEASFYFGAMNPTQARFEKCELRVGRSADLKYTRSSLPVMSGASDLEDRFEFALEPSAGLSLDYAVQLLELDHGSSIRVRTTCQSERFGSLNSRLLSLKVKRRPRAATVKTGPLASITTDPQILFLAVLLILLIVALVVVRRKRQQVDEGEGLEEEEGDEEKKPEPDDRIGSAMYSLLKRVSTGRVDKKGAQSPYGKVAGRVKESTDEAGEAPPLIDPYTKFKQQLLDGGFIDTEDLEAGILDDEEVAAEINRLLNLSKGEDGPSIGEMAPKNDKAAPSKQERTKGKIPPGRTRSIRPEGERAPADGPGAKEGPQVSKDDHLEHHLRDEESLKRQVQALDSLLKGQNRPDTGPEPGAKAPSTARSEPKGPPKKAASPPKSEPKVSSHRAPADGDDIEEKLKWLDDTLESHKDADDE